MSDRIEEIKARCEAAIKTSRALYTEPANIFDIKEIIESLNDIPFLLREIDRLKMMLDAEVAGKETMQRKMVERNENLRLDYLDAIAERDAAVADLNFSGSCDTCKNDETLGCHVDAETGSCNYEWRGVQK